MSILTICFKMEDSKDENIVQNEDKDVAKPEIEDTINVKTNEVTEEPPEDDLDKNLEETPEESEEEESQRTETEPSTQPMTSRSEDEDKRVEVGIEWSQLSKL